MYISLCFIGIILPVNAVADDVNLPRTDNATPCASQIFAQALKQKSDTISEVVPEYMARIWAKQIMQSPEVLTQVMNCEEIQAAKKISDTQLINFSPVEYRFPKGRVLIINYTSSPKILQQHIDLAKKRSIPTGIPNPSLSNMNEQDFGKYMNTEPAWYGIMVVQHDSLSEFVGPDKNNTLSLKYIADNIDKIYPHGFSCTSKTGIAFDDDIINIAAHKTVGVGRKNSDKKTTTYEICSGHAYDDDSNDYYVAGDKDLSWVKYAEITGDIILTFFSGGILTAVQAGVKYVNSTRVAKKLLSGMKKLKEAPKVKEYIRISQEIATHTDDINKIKNAASKATPLLEEHFKLAQRIEDNKSIVQKLTQQAEKMASNFSPTKSIPDDYWKILEKIDSTNKEITQLEKIAFEDQKYLKPLGDIYDSVKNLEQGSVTARHITEAAKTEEKVAEITTKIKDLEAARNALLAESSVKKFKNAQEELTDILKYRRELRALKRVPHTGNILVRTYRFLKAANSGAKTISKASKVARATMSTKSAKFLDWLFESSLKHGARLVRFERDVSVLGGISAFVLDMYDDTSATSKQFSNGIEFKPLGLLSADDIPGQENEVNYGMWLMWMGDSFNPADDDAAYLQAMDFANKFSEDLQETQEQCGTACNIDIYVVRPFIKLDETNPDDPHGEMFYLFMNDTPWTTYKQFKENIKDIAKWESEQTEKIEENYVKKHGKRPENPETQNEPENAIEQTVAE